MGLPRTRVPVRNVCCGGCLMLFRSRKAQEQKPEGDTSSAPRVAPRSASESIKPVTPPPPPPRLRRRRGGFLSTLSAALSVLLFLGFAVVGGVVFVKQAYDDPGPLAEDKVVIVGRGDGIDEIAAQLQREGVISHPSLLVAAVYVQGLKIKAGEYLFKANVPMRGVVDTLVEGKAILHSLTIPEGLTSEQIVNRLNENDILTGEVREIPREGTLMPDTYKFQRGATREQIIAAMAQAQRRVLNEVWARRAADIPVRTPQELVILASIVEKETGRADERTRVAGVFINRLQRRMKLQSDPTIVYGIAGGKGTLGRGILRSEIERPTPYNTYVIEGLPPGPIANPGRAAMEAVANPSRTRELFFVADGTGGHAFAETYEQHRRNVARWRQIEAGRASDPSANVDRIEPPADGATDTSGDPATRANAFAPADGAIDTFPVPGTRAPAANQQRRNQPGTANQAQGRRNVDASEGTPRDPLLNRSFDLNSPKTIPQIRP